MGDKEPFFSNIFGKKKNTGLIHRAEVAVGIKEEEKNACDEMCEALGCSKMPWKYRIAGYATCCGIGFLMSLGATGRISELIAGSPDAFVLLFTFGALIALVGCMFLSTPKKFCQKALDKDHWGAFVFYILSIIITLFCVYYDKMPSDGRFALIILSILVQYLSYLWFSLSMIPFVARMQKEFCRTRCRQLCPCLPK